MLNRLAHFSLKDFDKVLTANLPEHLPLPSRLTLRA